MRTYTKNLMAENVLIAGLGYHGLWAGKSHAATGAKGETAAGKRVKNIALFFAAPFIGLAYLLAFPFVGIGLLAWIGVKSMMNSAGVRPVALAIAAPFIGLAFATVGPVAGLVMLARIGCRAALKP
jgi:hypothetical protein